MSLEYYVENRILWRTLGDVLFSNVPMEKGGWPNDNDNDSKNILVKDKTI